MSKWILGTIVLALVGGLAFVSEGQDYYRTWGRSAQIPASGFSILDKDGNLISTWGDDNSFTVPTGQVKIPTSGSTGGIVLGGDANLYRNEANVLKTDDDFVVGGGAIYANVLYTVSGSRMLGYSGESLHVGTSAGYSSTGINNTYIGFTAGNENVSGGYNTYVGRRAGRYGDFGSHNTALGTSAGNYVQGSNNTLLGSLAGFNITDGTGNIIIGYNQDTPTATTSDHLNIGGTIYGDLANKRVGVNTTTITNLLTLKSGGGHAIADGWDVHSIARDPMTSEPIKINIRDASTGAEIKTLSRKEKAIPRTYQLNPDYFAPKLSDFKDQVETRYATEEIEIDAESNVGSVREPLIDGMKTDAVAQDREIVPAADEIGDSTTEQASYEVVVRSATEQYQEALERFNREELPRLLKERKGFIVEELPAKYVSDASNGWSVSAFVVDHEERIQQLEAQVAALLARLESR
jgi:hypothetical protein